MLYFFSSTVFNIIFKPVLNISFNFFDKIQDLFLNFSPMLVGRHINYVGVIIFIFVLGILIYLNKNKFLRHKLQNLDKLDFQILNLP